jgi:hypothetical protein
MPKILNKIISFAKFYNQLKFLVANVSSFVKRAPGFQPLDTRYFIPNINFTEIPVCKRIVLYNLEIHIFVNNKTMIHASVLEIRQTSVQKKH